MSNKISSDLIFHFTKKWDTIISIMKNGFYPRAPKENIDFLWPQLSNLECENRIPMVCFIEISIEMSKKHREEYGSYGLGLSKDWAVKNGLNPVCYVVEKSALQLKFNAIQQRMLEMREEITNKKSEELVHDNEFLKDLILIMDFSGYMKKYSEKKDGKVKINFDEREWRYLPPFFDGQEENMQEEYCNRLILEELTESKKDKLNKKMEEKYTLKFSIDDDLEKIIVPEGEDKHKIEKDLESLNPENYGNLLSKIAVI